MDGLPHSLFHRLSIADRRVESSDCVSLAFAVPEALREVFAFAPGQYLTLRAVLDGEEVRRSYSICSGLDDGELRIAIKQMPGGRFSGFATTMLRVGEMIDVMPPAGRFGHGALGTGRVYAAFAAGSGITPILSLMRSILGREPGARFVLFNGSRSTADILFRETLEDLKDRYLDRLSIFQVLSRERQDVAILNGHLDDDKLRAVLPGLADPASIDQAFLCGPAAMIAALSDTLIAMGVAAERVHVEHFTPAEGAGSRRVVPVAQEAAGFATATILFEGKASEIAIAAGESVLDAALRAGLDLPWSCRGGMCSTCRACLREGTAEMAQNFSLEPWETEAGFVLTCQARPTSGHLLVDYDHL
jgi:ring-1,2-phenylacetyl-CoA epoxidase subunit PaaE